MSDFEFQDYREDHLHDVVDLLTRAFLENPLHLAIFGGAEPEAIRKRHAVFAFSLESLSTGTKVVALRGGRVVGFAHWVRYPGCRPDPEAMAAGAPRLLAELGNEVASRVMAWRRAWGEQDPEGPHVHFGPLAVLPEQQGRGIGRRLLDHFCAAVDRIPEPAYLETERRQNVSMYRRSGFEITSQREVLGLPSWFMTRPALAGRPEHRAADADTERSGGGTELS